jgi:assimilatory nitrate reductase catalytic subunit
VIFRAAHPQALPESRLQEIDSLFGLGDDAAAIVYVDHRRQISKRALAPDGKLIGVRLAGETQAEVWLKEVMADDTLDAELIRWAVAPIGKRPGKLPVRSASSANAPTSPPRRSRPTSPGATLAVLQEQRKCGTFCGSCLPELRQMISDQAQHASDAAVL